MENITFTAAYESPEMGPNGLLNITNNMSHSNASAGKIPFFTNYYANERIIAESFLALIAFGLNAVAFITSRQQQHQHYAYFALFKNLTFANALFCLSLWLSNNILIIFASYLSKQSLCTLMSMMVIALIANSVFGLVSTSTLMGFSIVHYIAVCHPQTFSERVNRLTIKTSIIAIWGIYCTLAVVPIFILMVKVLVDCGEDKLQFIELLSRAFINLAITLLQIVVLIVFGFCVRIHKEIKTLQSRLSHFCWVDEMELERRTFRSIALLMGTLILFFVPFNIVFVISYNQNTADMMNSKATLFFMTLLPYVKFTTDPILYRKTTDDFQTAMKCFIQVCRCRRCHKVELEQYQSSVRTKQSTYRNSSWRGAAKGRPATVL